MQQTDQKALERRSQETATRNTEPSKTIQGAAHDADINNIAKSFGLGRGPMPIPAEIFDPANYLDLEEAPESLHDAMQRVREAESAFMRLPAELRRRFADDPGNLWEFLQNPANAQEAVDLGLLVAREPIASPRASQADPAVPGSGVPAPATGA